jgi:hypothetical protein
MLTFVGQGWRPLLTPNRKLPPQITAAGTLPDYDGSSRRHLADITDLTDDFRYEGRSRRLGQRFLQILSTWWKHLPKQDKSIT